VWTVSVSAGQSLLPAVVALWLLGVLAFSVRLFGGWGFTSRLRYTAHPAPAEWQLTLEQIASSIGAMRSVRHTPPHRREERVSRVLAAEWVTIAWASNARIHVS
jgi:hypothetical protein